MADEPPGEETRVYWEGGVGLEGSEGEGERLRKAAKRRSPHVSGSWREGLSNARVTSAQRNAGCSSCTPRTQLARSIPLPTSASFIDWSINSNSMAATRISAPPPLTESFSACPRLPKRARTARTRSGEHNAGAGERRERMAIGEGEVDVANDMSLRAWVRACDPTSGPKRPRTAASTMARRSSSEKTCSPSPSFSPMVRSERRIEKRREIGRGESSARSAWEAAGAPSWSSALGKI